MTCIKIIAGSVELKAELNDSPAALAIATALPIEGSANTWGDEIYFNIPVAREQDEDARADVDVGELGYWPVGQTFCIFFGPTPVSTDDKPRAASPVNIIGKVIGDATLFRSVRGGEKVRLENSDS